MVNLSHPFISNTGKRLVKTPKVYLSDSEIANALLGIKTFEQLMGHPSLGSLWESCVLTNLKGHFPSYNFFFLQDKPWFGN